MTSDQAIAVGRALRKAAGASNVTATFAGDDGHPATVISYSHERDEVLIRSAGLARGHVLAIPGPNLDIGHEPAKRATR